VDVDEASPDQLAPNDAVVELDVDPKTGDFGEPMHELDGLELSPVFMSPVDAWSQDVQERAEHLLQLARDVEPEVGLMVESAEDARARRSAYPSIWPVEGHFTSGFGYRRSPFTRVWKFHSGVDISAPRGTKVRAASSGVIERAAYTGGYGKLVEIDHGYGVKSRYAHNNRVYVKPGQVVQQGQVIATVGTTGQSTGPHLHFEVMVEDQKVNPMAYLPRRKLGQRAISRPAP
jgi:murein DD-endopeptidase MepM/ murein hydrolase activator NlpD